MRSGKKTIAVIVQCRLSSTRLPGKAVKDLGGRTVLEWTLAAMKKVKADHYYVATDDASHETLLPICQKNGFGVFKGPLDDVLERYCLLAEKLECTTILRATADNPFLFYEAAELLCEEFERQSKISGVDYMTWTGLPHGSGVEIFSSEAILKSRNMNPDSEEKEHVGPFLYKRKNVFSSLFYRAPSRFFHPEYRTTIDTPSDYRRALSIVNFLSGGKFPENPYTTEEILSAVKNPSVSNTVLFIPSVKKGRGTGHLRRCLSAAASCGGFVYVPKDADLEGTSEIIQEAVSSRGLKKFQIVEDFPEENEYSLIVTDLFRAEKDFYAELWKKGKVLSIDEGSDFSENADFLLDVIPSYGLYRRPNADRLEFIDFPHNVKKEPPREIKKVLVAFGGEDPENLTAKVEKYFCGGGLSVSAVRPSSPVQNLKEKLFEYDLVVSHYGLTALEAAYAGCSVLLFPVSRLHENLSKKYGFSLLDEKDLEKPFDRKYVSSPEKLVNHRFYGRRASSPAAGGFSDGYAGSSSDGLNRPLTGGGSLGEYIKVLSDSRRLCCPVCQSFPARPDPVAYRCATRTYRRCRTCSILYLSFSADGEEFYENEYFAEEYRKQYGKTYLEDFASIKKTGSRRISEISSVFAAKNSSKKTVLDVGCAYGPFLSAALDANWLPFGTDISDGAVNYVQNSLLIPAVKSAFPDFDGEKEFGISRFDAVSMWFVIEHFKNLGDVLKKVSSILKKGGVFAFSTPSAEGISARKNTEAFFEESPKDHYSLWEPSSVRKILKRFGFRVVKMVSTGHHAERFPLVKKNGWKKDDAMFSIVELYSKGRFLGDTFEVYCIKEF